jgi:hypothetical protein
MSVQVLLWIIAAILTGLSAIPAVSAATRGAIFPIGVTFFIVGFIVG